MLNDEGKKNNAKINNEKRELEKVKKKKRFIKEYEGVNEWVQKGLKERTKIKCRQKSTK